MIDVLVPRESVNDESVVVQTVMVADGGIVTQGQVVVEVETSKTAVAMTAPAAGKVRHHLDVGQEVEVGACLFSIVENGQQSNEDPADPDGPPVSMPMAGDGAQSAAEERSPLLSRAAQAAAAELRADLSGFAGRWVTRADVLRLNAERAERGKGGGAETVAAIATTERPAGDRGSVPQEPRFRPVARGKRKRVEIDNLLRGGHAATTSTIGIRLVLPGDRVVPASPLFRGNISDLLVYEGARTLRRFPDLNAFHLDERTTGLYEDIDFGVSFDSGRNLKVLVLREADRKSLQVVQEEFTKLLELYEGGGPVARELLEGATVTLSDLSSTGASFMLPLLNGRQALILGVVRRDRRELDLFASFDHRLSEGLSVARFLEELRERVLSHFRDQGGTAHVHCDGCGKSMQDEVRLGSRGFVRVVLPSGEEGGYCRNCFEGR